MFYGYEDGEIKQCEIHSVRSLGSFTIYFANLKILGITRLVHLGS